MSEPRARGAAEDAGRSALLVVGAMLAIVLMWALREIVMLVAFSMLLAYALDPLVGWVARLPLGRRRLPRPLAAGAVILALVTLAVWAAVVVTPRLVSEAASLLTGLPQRIQTLLGQLDDAANQSPYAATLGPMVKQLQSALPELQRGLLAWIGRLFSNVLQLAGLAVLPVLAFYLLAERGAVRASVMSFFPAEARPQLERLGQAVDRALASYVRGQAVVCLVAGAVMTVALTAIGISHALLLGFLVGLAEILPFLGFWMAAIAIGLVGLGEGPARAAIAIGAYILSSNLVGLLVTPRVMSRHLKLHPFVVTVSVLAGGKLLGPPGVLLALPAAAIAQALVQLVTPGRSEGQAEAAATPSPRR